MIKSLSGKTHHVYTGVTIIDKEKNKTQTFAEKTDVTVYEMTDDEIKKYADSEEPMDKAGAYGIQGTFAKYIKCISGDYNNVVGLPVSALYQRIKKLY
jgi:septum formation protein